MSRQLLLEDRWGRPLAAGLLTLGLYAGSALALPGAVDAAFVALLTITGVIVWALFGVTFRHEFFLDLLVALLVLQTTALGLFLAEDPAEWAVLFIELKTLLLYGGAVISLGSTSAQRRLRPFAMPMLLLAGWVAFRSIPPSDPVATLGYVRNFTSLLAIGVIAAAAPWPDRTVRRWLFPLAPLLLGVYAGAMVVEVAVGSEAWRSFFNFEVIASLKGPFSTGTDLFGVVIPRLATLSGEAVNAAYLLGTAALLWWYRGGARLDWRLFLGAIVTLVPLGKGGLLLFVVAVIVTMALHRRARPLAVPVRALAVSLILAVAATFAYVAANSGIGVVIALIGDPASAAFGGNSAQAHVAGLVSALRGIESTPFGAGVGTGGNFGEIAGIASGVEWIESGAESGLGVLVAQLGAPGLFLFGWLVILLLREAQSSPYFAPATGLLAGWLAGALFQENPLGPQAGLLPMLSIWLLVLSKEAIPSAYGTLEYPPPTERRCAS